jgi:hypothetical protein
MATRVLPNTSQKRATNSVSRELLEGNSWGHQTSFFTVDLYRIYMVAGNWKLLVPTRSPPKHFTLLSSYRSHARRCATATQHDTKSAVAIEVV